MREAIFGRWFVGLLVLSIVWFMTHPRSERCVKTGLVIGLQVLVAVLWAAYLPTRLVAFLRSSTLGRPSETELETGNRKHE